MEQRSARTTRHVPGADGYAPRPAPAPAARTAQPPGGAPRRPVPGAPAPEGSGRAARARTPEDERGADAGRSAGDRRPRRAPRVPGPTTPAPRAPARGDPSGRRRQAGRASGSPASGAPRGGGRGRTPGNGGGIPAPRLTGLGAGVLAGAVMLAVGGIEGLLTDGAPVFYGIFFVLACVACGLWVRPAELFAAPVVAPLAFTLGRLPAGGDGDGFLGLLRDVFTNLALQAGWLYAGTLTAALIVLARKAALAVLRRRRRGDERRVRGHRPG
ncbi:DUF6542 domain-containing protein [Streptomyces sp. NRRL S-1868]|uniref:DUF6542 domain-containing protein n=1 Tax=Streptomyces sp. NRRL S-1868 TaxID=1463892 RepID=UPI003B63A9C5